MPSKPDFRRGALRRLESLNRPELLPETIKDVVVISAGSRCGSSFLFHLLRRTGRFWTLNGEETPFYRACGLGEIHSVSDSDRLRPKDLSSNTSKRLLNLWMADLGRFDSRARLDRSDSLRRMLLQRPLLAGRFSRLERTLDQTSSKSSAEMWPEWLRALELNDAGFDGSSKRAAPRGVSFEETPWVIPSPVIKPTANDLGHFPLLLKTSTNAYRADLLRSLFPQARFRFIHLSRNPLGAANGLMDGWLSPHFGSHRLGSIRRLKIDGYSHRTHGSSLWKFDLPPDWAEFTARPLEHVAGFQWASAYSHWEKNLAGDARVHRMKYEDLSDPSRTRAEINAILEFLKQTPITGRELERETARPVMATRPPEAGRWRRREKILRPLLAEKRIRDQAESMGYDPERWREWK